MAELPRAGSLDLQVALSSSERTRRHRRSRRRPRVARCVNHPKRRVPGRCSEGEPMRRGSWRSGGCWPSARPKEPSRVRDQPRRSLPRRLRRPKSSFRLAFVSSRRLSTWRRGCRSVSRRPPPGRWGSGSPCALERFRKAAWLRALQPWQSLREAPTSALRLRASPLRLGWTAPWVERPALDCGLLRTPPPTPLPHLRASAAGTKRVSRGFPVDSWWGRGPGQTTPVKAPTEPESQ
jgi:hypothetical protein